MFAMDFCGKDLRGEGTVVVKLSDRSLVSDKSDPEKTPSAVTRLCGSKVGDIARICRRCAQRYGIIGW